MSQTPDLQRSLSTPINLENCNQITTNLFLGGINAALQTEVLVDQGIHAVVCCVRELEFPTCDFHKDLEYYRVDVEDIGREPIELFWPEATEFIHSYISQGQPVLVHCKAGVSRSASTVIAYLIQYQGYSLRDAFNVARSRRPVVTPNLGFMQKLIDFETSELGSKPTISMNKYSSWYCGSQMAAVPDVGSDDVTENVQKSAVAAGTMNRLATMPNLASNATLARLSLDSTISDGTVEDQVIQLDSTTPLADVKSVSWSPGSGSGVQPGMGPTLSSASMGSNLRFRKAVHKVTSIMSLTRCSHKDGIDSDLLQVVTENPVVLGRVERIRTILLRHAARDPELGYCQGMHLVAAIFAASASTQAEAYWRFNAFVGSIRGLWLPGFPLLAAGASQFEALAQHRPWFQHFQACKVESSMYLPQAWLGVFASWLPLHTLTESLELLEGHVFAGMLGMTLAILDYASAELMQQDSSESILELLGDFKEKAPSPASLAKATRIWVPTVVAALAASYAHVVAQPSKHKRVEMHSRREGSRVLVHEERLDLPPLSLWVSMTLGLTPMSTRMIEEPAPSQSASTSCWSWCWPSKSTMLAYNVRASPMAAEQKRERHKSMILTFESAPSVELRNERARAHARKSMRTISWAERDD